MKIRKILAFLACITLGIASFPGALPAQAPAEGEEAVFATSIAPDALIVLDLSGSMLWSPPGETMYISNTQTCGSDVAYYPTSGTGHTWPCTIDAYGTVPRYGDATCAGPFYRTSTSMAGYTTNCRRVMIARRAIFDILDDNNDNTVNADDETSLNVRVGYMRFINGNDTGGNYASGNIKYVRAIGSKYSLVYCANSTSCTATSTSTSSCVANSSETGNSGTPLASALNEAKLYLDAHKAMDAAASCRQKFVILISDGADTYGCSGSGSEEQADQYKRRRESVAVAKALGDAGYKTFVIGFGTALPDYLKNTLNWMAYYGGTDNPNQVNSGDTSGYSISTGCAPNDTPPVTTPCCNLTTNPTSCFPSGVTSCMTSSTTGTCDGTSTSCYATANDPGTATLSGYAFLASDATAMATALKTAINIIREATYSFTQASVQSSRTLDENFLYEASFEPISSDPFWRGHLKKYAINDDGSVGTMMLDAADVLFAKSASSRTMKTCIACTSALTDFTTGIDKSYFDVSTDAERDAIVGYFRGESTYNPEVSGSGIYKMGDVFRSTPITVGTPSSFFDDVRDLNHAFATHRTNHTRSSALGNRLIIAGANDGQLHAFKTSDMSEAWSFIPPNLLPKLKNIAHSAHPTALTHQYYVDGPVTVADVWLGASGDGTSKSAADWRTILILAEARGSSPNLWSSSSTCDSGFSSVYTSGYPYYCGYYALDLHDSLSPTFKWHLGGAAAIDAAQAPYLGEPWSKVMTGRVMINNVEKWVGFMGAGYNATDCTGGTCDTRGKGFFVIDLSNGQILWSYTRADNTDMNYSLPAAAAIVDTDKDGFIDTAYIGDMGGSVWRIKFCTNAMGTSCNTSNWAGGRLFASSTGSIRPIYTVPAVATDGGGNLWVYWGTGDKTDPTASSSQEKFFGLKDNDRTSTRGTGEMQDISSTTDTFDNTSTTLYGYYMTLPGTGEKILADPTVFGGVVYFTTYVPASSSDPCDQGGESYVYGIRYTSGAGAFTGGARSMSLGVGIASAPIVSVGPTGTTDLYVTVSGAGGSGGSTFRLNFNPPGVANRTNILYWRDQRLQ